MSMKKNLSVYVNLSVDLLRWCSIRTMHNAYRVDTINRVGDSGWVTSNVFQTVRDLIFELQKTSLCA